MTQPGYDFFYYLGILILNFCIHNAYSVYSVVRRAFPTSVFPWDLIRFGSCGILAEFSWSSCPPFLLPTRERVYQDGDPSGTNRRSPLQPAWAVGHGNTGNTDLQGPRI